MNFLKLHIKKNKIAKQSLILLFVFFLISNLLSAQTIINKIEVNPLNRLIINLSTYPFYYSAELSNDKKRLSITIENCSFADNLQTLKSSGIITDVYLKKEGSNTKLEIFLAEKRGYTAVALPYSKSIFVEIFSWDKLTPDEDLFRTGLLSFEEKILNSAKNDLTNAAIQGNKISPAYLGIVLLKMGKPNSAKANLLFAEKVKSDVPDIYAALAQIFLLKNDKVWFDYYNQKFVEATGLPNFTQIETAEIIEKDSMITEPVDHLKNMNEDANQDSTATDTTQNKNELNSKFKNIIGDSSKVADANQTIGFMPWWIGYVAAFAGVIVLLVIYFYLKWRNQRLAMLETIRQENFKANIKASNPATAKPKANRFAEAYKKQESLASDKPAKPNKVTPTKPSINQNDDEIEYERDIKTKPKIDKKTKREVENFLSTIKEKFPTKSLSDKIKTDLEKKSPPVSAKVELAMHLAEEQQKIRARSLTSLDEKEIPKDDSGLTKIAKQLGVEKGSLETRKNLEKIKSDLNSLKKLGDKFSLNKNDEEK